MHPKVTEGDAASGGETKRRCCCAACCRPVFATELGGPASCNCWDKAVRADRQEEDGERSYGEPQTAV